MAISDYINKRRESNKATPWAEWIDKRRENSKNTPYADWLGYDSPESVVDPVLTPQQACEKREGYHWGPNSFGYGGACVPNEPYTPETGGGGEEDFKDVPGGPPPPINTNYDISVQAWSSARG